MLEDASEFFLSSKARYQNSGDPEDAAELYFAIRNMVHHGMDVEWDRVLLKAMEDLGDPEKPLLERPEEKPKQRLGAAVEGKEKVRKPGIRPRGAERRDRYRIDPHLMEMRRRTMPGGEDHSGEKLPSETQDYYASRMVGRREAKGSNVDVIPSRYFNIGSYLRYKDKFGDWQNLDLTDIDTSIWFHNTLEELYEKRDEKVPGDAGYKGVTYGDYLRPLIGRPSYTGEGEMNPVQALHIFSDSPNPHSVRNAAHAFHSEFLNPDSPHFVKKIEQTIKEKNDAINEAWGGNLDKTHLRDMRATNKDGDVVGALLPPSQTFSRMYEESYQDWLDRVGDRLSDDMDERDKRLLYSRWFDLEFDIGQDDDYITMKLLTPNGELKRDYSRSNLMIDPDYVRKRDEEQYHQRVGILPWLFGLQLCAPEQRKEAFAELISYLKEDGDHPIELSAEERAKLRDENPGKMPIEKMLDHMHVALGRNLAALAVNLMAHPLEAKRGHIPPYFSAESRLKKAIIKDALSQAHLMPLSPEYLAEWSKRKDRNEDVEALTGYDDVGGTTRSREKSISAHLKSSLTDDWDHVHGVPKEWDFDNDPLEEFEEYVKYLPMRYRASARNRFRTWLMTDPRGAIRGISRRYQLDAAHEFWPLEPLVEGEHGEPHEDVDGHSASPTYLWHSSLPKTGQNLYAPDIAEILYSLMPCLGEKVMNRDLILFDTYGTYPPPIGSEEYNEWLKGIGNGDSPESWDRSVPFSARGGMSALAKEIDIYLREGHLGSILEDLDNRLYGHLASGKGVSPEDFVSRILSARFGELLQAAEGEDPEGERAHSLDILDWENDTGMGQEQRSSLLEGRGGGDRGIPAVLERDRQVEGADDVLRRVPTTLYPFGRRPMSDRVFRLMLPIAGVKDAVFLREASQMGIREPSLKLRTALDGKVTDETRDALLEMREAIERRGDIRRQMVERASILRGSSGGMVLPYHARGAFLPSETIKMLRLSELYGKGVVRRAKHDGFRDVKGLRVGAGLIDLLGQSGITTNIGRDAGQLLLLTSALMGHGDEGPWAFDHDGGDKLVLDEPMHWGDRWVEQYADWLNETIHPHRPGESLGGHLGITKAPFWADHPDVADGRYLYPVTKEVGDTGHEEFRLPMVKRGKNETPVPNISTTPLSCPRKYENSSQWNNSFSVWDSYLSREQGGLKDVIGTEGLYPGKPWLVVPSKSVITGEDGEYYVIADHPSQILQDYSKILAQHDVADKNHRHRDLILSLRGEARRIAPKEEGEHERERDWASKSNTHDFLIRLLATRHQAARAVLPLLIAKVADSFDLDMGDISNLTSEDIAHYKLNHFIENHLRQHSGDSLSDSKRKHAAMCYLYDKAAEYADLSHIEGRLPFLQSLEKEGYHFDDEVKERFLAPNLGTNTVFGYRLWNKSERPDIGAEHPFYQAYRESSKRDVEGLNLLRSYVNKIYDDNPDTAEAILDMMESHYLLHGKLSRERGQPVPPDPKTLSERGKKAEHYRAIINAQHHEVGREDDPLHYFKESDAPYSDARPERRAKNSEMARKGFAAQQTLDLKAYFDEKMDSEDPYYSPVEAIRINDFITAITPVMEELVRDLRGDHFLPEHRPHQELKVGDREDILREYCRLLHLRGRVNSDYENVPWPRYTPSSNAIGDTRSSDDEIAFDRIRLPDLSSVHSRNLFSEHEAIPFRIEIGGGLSKTGGSQLRPGAVVRESRPPWDVGVVGGWDDPSRARGMTAEDMQAARGDPTARLTIPYIAYHPKVLNSAFGTDYAVSRPNDNIGAPTRYTEGDGVVETSLDVLTDVDLLLKDEDRVKGKPSPIKAMHRIFSLDDLQHLRGFSDDWVVTLWPDGMRVIVEKTDGKLKVRGADGKSQSLPNEVRRGVKDSHDKDFLVDAVWDNEKLHIIDILECGDVDLSEKPAKDRSRHLRAKFESTEQVVTPAPVNTKRVDGEGLQRAVDDLMGEKGAKQVLLRDAESTYMRGESRHPKWILLNPDQQVDVIILSSTSDGNHLLGIGPLYEEDAKAIGNRAHRYDGDFYMDVGNVNKEGLEEGMYITVKISGISHSVRRNYSVYRLNAPRYLKESESRATDSIETLDILQQRQNGNVPHKVRIKKGKIHIDVPTGHVVYETEPYGNAFILKGVDYPDDYTLRIVESQIDYWSPLAAVLLRSEKESQQEHIEPEPPANHNKKPKKVIPAKDRLLKDPEMVKSMVVALEMIERVLKEKITWTGPKGLGIDYATPVESPSGPTQNTEPYNLPDHDPAARQKDAGSCWCGAERGAMCEMGMGHKMEDCPKARPESKDEEPEHLKISHNSQ